MSRVEDLPERWKGALYMEDVILDGTTIEELVTQINFLRGSLYGQAMLIDAAEEKAVELEEQVELARDYQREIDARLVDGLPHYVRMESSPGYVVGGYSIPNTETSYVYDVDPAKAIRESK